MGRRLSGYYKALLCLIPVGSFSMFHFGVFFIISFLVAVMFSVVPTFKSTVSAAMMSIFKPRRPRRSRSSRSKARKFRRRHLPYHLVQRCLSRNNTVLVDPRVRRHRRWRRRKLRSKQRWKVKCSTAKLAAFLDPSRRHVKRATTTTVSPVRPFEANQVSEEVLDEFVCERGETFLSAPKLLGHFQTISVEDGASQTVGRLNLFKVANDATTGNVKQRQTFKDCPLV